MIPQPIVAVIMLFPLKESSELYLQQEADKISSQGQYVDPSVYYMKQTVGYACGTVGDRDRGNLQKSWWDRGNPRRGRAAIS